MIGFHTAYKVNKEGMGFQDLVDLKVAGSFWCLSCKVTPISVVIVLGWMCSYVHHARAQNILGYIRAIFLAGMESVTGTCNKFIYTTHVATWGLSRLLGQKWL